MTFSSVPLRGQVEDLTGFQLNDLTLKDGTLFYKSDCVQAGLTDNVIRRRPVEGDRSYTIYQTFGCSTTVNIHSALDVDDTHVYWITGNGRIRKMVQTGLGLAETIYTSVTPELIGPNSPVAVSPGFVYWTEEQTEFRDRSIIYRVSKAVGSSPQLVLNYSAQGNSKVLAMAPAGDSRLLLLLSDGRLVDARRVAQGEPPFVLFFWRESATVSAEATAMRVVGDRLWWTDRSSDGRSIFFRSAPLDDLATESLHHLAFRTATHNVFEFATDGATLFYHDLTSSSAGPIMRKRVTDSSDAVALDSLLYRAENMHLTERHVWWRKNLNTISRLPIDAAAVERDLSATGLEVIQVLQNSGNDNPLVMGKPTFVRVFGQIRTSTAGETSLNFWPGAFLYGEKNGVPLEGSPLGPYQTAPLISGPSFRTREDHGFWFRLPDSWTRQGVVRLRGVINPSRVLEETTYGNNTRTFDANFVRQAAICMVMKPTRTRRGTIYNYNPYMQPTFDYIEALLPVSELRVIWGGGLIQEPYDPFGWVGDGGPFEVTDADDDGATMLIELNTRKVFTTRRYCEPFSGHGFDHYVAMLKFQGDRPWNGYAHRGNDGINHTVSASAFFDIPRPNALGVPSAAATQCQELAHNYGRQHIDCGDPDNVDTSYPYDTDKLYSPGLDYLGFNPFTRRLIMPDTAADYMTYCGPEWTSDYSWRALVNLIGDIPVGGGEGGDSGSGESTAGEADAGFILPQPPSGSSLIMGFVDMHESRAAFKQVMPLPGAQELAAAQAMIGGLSVESEFEIRARGADATLGTYPVYMNEVPTDEGAEHSLFFMSIGDLDAATDQLEFLSTANGERVLGAIQGGGSPPDISIDRPSAGSAHSRTLPLLMSWSASDPDGDPLVYTVRFSPDGGTTWQALASSIAETLIRMPVNGLPGGDECLIEVMASDGILTTTARSGVFSLEMAAPQAYAFVETPRGKECRNLGRIYVKSGEGVILHGEAFDDEDGEIDGDSLLWSIGGPVQRFGGGRQFLAEDLPPGEYAVELRAIDSDQRSGTARLNLTVDPHYVEDAGSDIVLDGHPDDPGYLRDRQPLRIRYANGHSALVRLVHRSGRLYVCASGLRVGNHDEPGFSVVVDANRSRGSSPGTGDLKFDVYADGRVRAWMGNGSSFVEDSTPNGLMARVYAHGGFWSAELCLMASRFGGWNGQTIGLGLIHEHIDTSGETARAWPVNAFAANPSTYGAVVMGLDPHDVTDLDGDGLPDRWELESVGDIKPTADDDTDGDGQSNGEEWEAGTDPTNPDSLFRIQLIKDEETTRLTWTPHADRSYNVLRSHDAVDWDPAAFDVGGGQWTAPDGEGTPAFYQVEVCHGR